MSLAWEEAVRWWMVKSAMANLAQDRCFDVSLRKAFERCSESSEWGKPSRVLTGRTDVVRVIGAIRRHAKADNGPGRLFSFVAVRVER
jgi:hypothetical protein